MKLTEVTLRKIGKKIIDTSPGDVIAGLTLAKEKYLDDTIEAVKQKKNETKNMLTLYKAMFKLMKSDKKNEIEDAKFEDIV